MNYQVEFKPKALKDLKGMPAVQERLADAEDILELRKAKRRERQKPSIPLAQVKRQLGFR